MQRMPNDCQNETSDNKIKSRSRSITMSRRILLIACMMTDKKYRKIGGSDGRLEEAVRRWQEGKDSTVLVKQIKLKDVIGTEEFTENFLKNALEGIEGHQAAGREIDLILVHKYTDYYKMYGELEKLGTWLNDLSEIGSLVYKYKHKHDDFIDFNVNVRVMDVPKRIDLLTNRVETGNLVQKMCKNEGFEGKGLQWPEFTCDFGAVADNDTKTKKKKMMIESERLIIKPINACASDDAHWMTIVSTIPTANEAGSLMEGGMLAQRFYKHYGILYKIYVVGKVIEIVPRRSVEGSDYDSSGDQFRFNTHIFKKEMEELSEERQRDALERIEPFKEIIIEFARSLRENLQIRWLGIDIIIPEPETDNQEENALIKLAVIDVNYMPGYDGVNELSEKFMEAILEKK